jgi:hypothetical protein
MKLSTDPPLPRLSHNFSVSHRVPCTAGNLDTPRNSGAADTALANARPVSPSASYLKRHQVTKCPSSWLGSSFVGIPSLRRRSVGPPPSAIHGGGRLSRHPCRSAHSTSPAFGLHPVAICRVWAIAFEDQDQDQQRTRLSVSTQFLWETPEVTMVRAAIRTMAVGLVAHLLTDPPLRCRRDLRRLPQGLVFSSKISARHTRL